MSFDILIITLILFDYAMLMADYALLPLLLRYTLAPRYL